MSKHSSELPESHSETTELSLKEIFIKTKEWIFYLKTKWIVIFIGLFLGAAIGYVYASYQKIFYTASLSFALEDEHNGSGGFSGALGLANSLGLDLGTGAGGAFNGANLIELMKSRTIVEKALLNPVDEEHQRESLASYYIRFNHLDKDWDKNPKLKGGVIFEPYADRSHYTLQQDSILGQLYESIAGTNGMLLVLQKDKKVSILTIEVKSINELFAKKFSEIIAKEVSEFYVDSKSKKAKSNVLILQKQTDSIRNELNAAITGVAIANDNTFNLNPALLTKKTPSMKRQVDVQANTAILTQLVANLEMAKVTLRKETPLIQIIDKPILPLKKEKVSKLKSLIVGGFIGGLMFISVIFLRRIVRESFFDNNSMSA